MYVFHYFQIKLGQNEGHIIVVCQTSTKSGYSRESVSIILDGCREMI